MSSEYSRFKYSVKRALIRDFKWERNSATRWMTHNNEVLRKMQEEGHKVGAVAEAIHIVASNLKGIL